MARLGLMFVPPLRCVRYGTQSVPQHIFGNVVLYAFCHLSIPRWASWNMAHPTVSLRDWVWAASRNICCKMLWNCPTFCTGVNMHLHCIILSLSLSIQGRRMHVKRLPTCFYGRNCRCDWLTPCERSTCCLTTYSASRPSNWCRDGEGTWPVSQNTLCLYPFSSIFASYPLWVLYCLYSVYTVSMCGSVCGKEAGQSEDLVQ